MWRPETKEEKDKRENPKAKDPVPVGQNAVQVHDYAANDQALRDVGCGSLVDCLNFIEYIGYVICCCGCGTSYEDYNDLQ